MNNKIKNLYVIMAEIFMGIADTLPSISGSTITYILGVYEEFIESISNINIKGKKKSSFMFLLKIGTGWIIGAVLSILLLGAFTEGHIYFITSLFVGLILSTIVLNFLNLKKVSEFTFENILFLMAGIIVTLIIFYFGWGIKNMVTDSFIYVYIFVVAIIAIVCMMLPGISGSTVMLIFGIYYPLIMTLESLLKGESINISFLFTFIMGGIIGLFGFAKIIHKLFDKHEIPMLNLILGILIGSIIPILYGPLTMEGGNYDKLNLSNVSVLGVILGVVILILLNKIKKIRGNTNE